MYLTDVIASVNHMHIHMLGYNMAHAQDAIRSKCTVKCCQILYPFWCGLQYCTLTYKSQMCYKTFYPCLGHAVITTLQLSSFPGPTQLSVACSTGRGWERGYNYGVLLMTAAKIIFMYFGQSLSFKKTTTTKKIKTNKNNKTNKQRQVFNIVYYTEHIILINPFLFYNCNKGAQHLFLTIFGVMNTRKGLMHNKRCMNHDLIRNTLTQLTNVTTKRGKET